MTFKNFMDFRTFFTDFRQHQTDDWLVFPYEISGLTLAEVREHKPFIFPLLATTPPTPKNNS